MAQKKTRNQLEEENKLLRTTTRVEGAVTLGREAIKYGGLGFIAWCAYRSIDALAGRDTSADISVGIFGTAEVSVALSWTTTLIAVAYGVQQRKLRKDTVERLQTRIIGLESHLDTRRSSSRLTPRGDTRPEDKK